MAQPWQPSLFEFMKSLEDNRIDFRLDRVRETVMVIVAIPGERWEVEFFEDGSIEVERFLGQGVVPSDGLLATLLES